MNTNSNKYFPVEIEIIIGEGLDQLTCFIQSEPRKTRILWKSRHEQRLA